MNSFSELSEFHIATPTGTYVCLCQTGFRARGDLCEDIDECAVRTHKCNANADCLNKVYDPVNEGKGFNKFHLCSSTDVKKSCYEPKVVISQILMRKWALYTALVTAN